MTESFEDPRDIEEIGKARSIQGEGPPIVVALPVKMQVRTTDLSPVGIRVGSSINIKSHKNYNLSGSRLKLELGQTNRSTPEIKEKTLTTIISDEFMGFVNPRGYQDCRRTQECLWHGNEDICFNLCQH